MWWKDECGVVFEDYMLFFGGHSVERSLVPLNASGAEIVSKLSAKATDMGAQIILCDPHRAVVIGHDRNFCLRGGNMTSPDIRAGIALLIAALSADGVSRIHNIEQIDRGYQNIEQRLTALGARITRLP